MYLIIADSQYLHNLLFSLYNSEDDSSVPMEPTVFVDVADYLDWITQAFTTLQMD